MMQKRPGNDSNRQSIAVTIDIELIERSDRTVRLAMSGSEGGEVMPTDQHLCSRLHHAFVELSRNTPCQASTDRQRRSPIDNPVLIESFNARKTCVPILGNDGAVGHRNGAASDKRVYRLHQSKCADVFCQVKVRPHCKGMHACVGPTCGMDSNSLCRQRKYSIFERLLDAWTVRLSLPTHEGAAIIFNRQRKSRQSCMPLGAGKPRRKSDMC